MFVEDLLGPLFLGGWDKMERHDKGLYPLG